MNRGGALLVHLSFFGYLDLLDLNGVCIVMLGNKVLASTSREEFERQTPTGEPSEVDLKEERVTAPAGKTVKLTSENELVREMNEAGISYSCINANCKDLDSDPGRLQSFRDLVFKLKSLGGEYSDHCFKDDFLALGESLELQGKSFGAAEMDSLGKVCEGFTGFELDYVINHALPFLIAGTGDNLEGIGGIEGLGSWLQRYSEHWRGLEKEEHYGASWILMKLQPMLVPLVGLTEKECNDPLYLQRIYEGRNITQEDLDQLLEIATVAGKYQQAAVIIIRDTAAEIEVSTALTLVKRIADCWRDLPEEDVHSQSLFFDSSAAKTLLPLIDNQSELETTLRTLTQRKEEEEQQLIEEAGIKDGDLL